jgi:hypothetical protein
VDANEQAQRLYGATSLTLTSDMRTSFSPRCEFDAAISGRKTTVANGGDVRRTAADPPRVAANRGLAQQWSYATTPEHQDRSRPCLGQHVRGDWRDIALMIAVKTEADVLSDARRGRRCGAGGRRLRWLPRNAGVALACFDASERRGRSVYAASVCLGMPR